MVVLLAGLPAFGGDSARVAEDVVGEESETAQERTETTAEAAQAPDAADAVEDDASQEDVPTAYLAQAEPENSPTSPDANAAIPKAGTDDQTADPEAAEGDKAPQDDLSVNAAVVEPDAWVEYDNVVFAAVVCLPQDVVGDALTDYAGKPYSNVNHPEDGVIGTGYAMTAEEAEHILRDILEVSDALTQNPDATTDLVCIVVTEGETPASTPAE